MSSLYLFDCAAGKLRRGQMFPLNVGNTADCACRLTMEAQLVGCFMQRNGQCTFYPRVPYRVNGENTSSSMELQSGTVYLMSVAKGLFAVMYDETDTLGATFQNANADQWHYFDATKNSWVGPYSMGQFSSLVGSLSADSWVMMGGLYSCMCHYGEFLEMASFAAGAVAVPAPTPMPVAAAPVAQPTAAVEPAPAAVPAAYPEEEDNAADTPHIDEDSGRYLCPTCWLRFDAGDVMNIANHPDLMGDPVLGRDAMLRFFATRFNAKGQALDDKGMPCMHYACPHCRRKLPPHFMELKHHIFSIIGAPSAGKSYYLASLVHEMEYTMGPQFGLGWKDASPTDNSMLNDVKNRLFSAESPADAYLSKTDLEGALYEEFYRHGRMVKLPRPFVYSLSKPGTAEPPTSLVFYDNAGEHFEPGRNSEDSPGAGHVAVASGLFFLFDPVTNRAFRKMSSGKDDPQLTTDSRHMDQQNIIMSETYARIVDTLNLGPGVRLDVPFAVMLGKCDLWEDALAERYPDAKLLPCFEKGRVIQRNVKANSDLLRRFLMDINPALCTGAESISSNVRYFAVSPLGCPPVRFTDPLDGVDKIGPDPDKIAPRYVCDPTLWVLSVIAPHLVPSV